MSLLPFIPNNILLPFDTIWGEPHLNHWPVMLPTRSEHLRDLRHQLAQLDRDTSIIVDSNHFQANIDVQQFTPEEISVKLSGNRTITVEAKHEEQEDGHGYVSRHFVRRYQLPQDCDVSKLRSTISSDGVLTVSAPKQQEDDGADLKDIPLIHTGKPIIKRFHWWPSRRGDKKGKIASPK